MKIVIIEGTDNVGKDTVIEQLKERYDKSIVFHCEKPKGKTPLEAAYEQEHSFLKLAGDTCQEYYEHYDDDDVILIHNRSWYGENVYGCMYRGNDELHVHEMILNIEKCLMMSIDKSDLCFITLLSDNVDFLIKNDDGLSISNANRNKIEKETQRFIEIFNKSIIENKHIVYVNNGMHFRPKAEIMEEIIKYIEQ